MKVKWPGVNEQPLDHKSNTTTNTTPHCTALHPVPTTNLSWASSSIQSNSINWASKTFTGWLGCNLKSCMMILWAY